MKIICHIISTLDGKITGDLFQEEGCSTAGSIYRRLRSEMKYQAVSYGSATMTESYGAVSDLSEPDGPASQADTIAAHDKSLYLISLDPAVVEDWKDSTIIRKGMDPAHIVEVVGSDVSDTCLNFLVNKGISYLYMNDADFDIPALVKKLEESFPSI